MTVQGDSVAIARGDRAWLTRASRACRGSGDGGALVAASARISVAMAAYNGGRFIAQQLESLALQTRPPDELVVSDDCSTDHTVEAIEDFARCCPFPVRLLRQDRNCGPNANFDRAVAACTGDLIFLCDQDDVWLPKKIAWVERAFARHPSVGLVVSNSELVDERLWSLGRNLYRRGLPRRERVYPKGSAAMQIVLAAGLVFGHTMAFRRRSCLLRPASEISADRDQDVIRAIVAAALSDVVVLPVPLVKYRRHAAQVSDPCDVPPTRLGRLRNVVMGAERQVAQRERFSRAALEMCGSLYKLGADAEALRVLRGRAEVAASQANLPASPGARVRYVLGNLLSGRSHRYANGLSTAVRDLIVPAARPLAAGLQGAVGPALPPGAFRERSPAPLSGEKARFGAGSSPAGSFQRRTGGAG